MVGHRASLSRGAACNRVVAGCRPSADLLIIPHPQGRFGPDMFFQNPMFSRPKLAFGPCGAHPPSYMSVNHRNIADV